MQSSKYTGTQEASRACVHARARGQGARPNVSDLLSRGSASFRRLNPGDQLPRPAAAEFQPVCPPQRQGPDQGGKAYTGVRVTVRSFRTRKCDPDNIVVKGVLDGLVAAGVIPDDDAEVVKGLTVEQVKVPKGEERTVIEVTQEV